jgi:hypothetical protein
VFFQILYIEKKVPGGFRMFYLSLREFIDKEIQVEKQSTSKIILNRELYLNHLSSAIISVIRFWIIENFNYSPKYLESQLLQIIRKPIKYQFQAKTTLEKEPCLHRIDPRIRRTTENLKKALLSLLQVKKIQTITVKDISKLSNCNRVTFYSHYRDKNHLMNEIIDEKIS